MRPSTPLVVTAAEAVDVLQALEPRHAADLNERKFHYTAALVGGETAGLRGATVLYDWQTVALVRLVLVLETSLSRPVARTVIAAVWQDVRQLMDEGRLGTKFVAVAIADRPPLLRQGPVVVPRAELRPEHRARIELRAVAEGVIAAMRRIRERNETIRMWADVSPSSATYRLKELREFAAV